MKNTIIVIKTVNIEPTVTIYNSIEDAREFIRKDFEKLAETNIGSEIYNEMVENGYCSYSEDHATLTGYYYMDIGWQIFSFENINKISKL